MVTWVIERCVLVGLFLGFLSADAFTSPTIANGRKMRCREYLTMAPSDGTSTSDLLHSAPSLLLSISTLSPTVTRSFSLGAFPAVGMLGATLLGIRLPTPPTVVGALQHFAAGILLTTVAKELLPEMVNAEGWIENLASGIGFFSGVGVLILLGIVFPEEEGEEHNTENKPEASTKKTSLRNRKQSRKAEAFARGSPASISPMRLGDELRTGWTGASDQGWETMGAEMDTFAPAVMTTSPPVKTMEEVPIPEVVPLPAALLAAVAVDCALDGLLIGTSTALDPSTGNILSASLAVESSFLGLTIAAALRACEHSWSLWGSTFLAPTSLLVAATAGGFLAPVLNDSPALLAGLLGFGTSATLFMVAEELLLEAHEDGGEHVWWVDFQLYTGFFASVMVDKCIT